MNSTVWKIALRTLARDKSYALLNVAGLALAVACCLILGVYLRSELTYDRSHANYKQIFRIANEFEINGKLDRFAATSTMLGPMLKDENSDVLAFVRFQGSGQTKRFIQHGAEGNYWANVYVTDPNVFDVFTHKIIYGDPKTALLPPTSIAVSRTLAKRYFGDKNPLGETLTIDGVDAQISLVFDDLPENTHLKYDALLTTTAPQFATPDDITQRRQRLFNIGVSTYLLMRPGYDPANWGEVSKAFFARNMTEIGSRINAQWRSWLQPLADIHLHSDVPDNLPSGNLYYLYGFVAVAVFTLLVASINYMNLATARAAKRAKEVGMRKILGSSRKALIAQFLAESMLLAVVSVVLGVLLVEVVVAFTPINELLGKPVSLSFTEAPDTLAWAAGLALLVGLGAGLYPAFYLSAAVPASALIGGARGGGRSTGLREALVFVQFMISVAVIACTLVMAAQMRYVSHMSLGFERENRVNVTLRGVDTITASDAIKTELLRNPNVLGVSWAASTMGGDFPINVIGLENNDGTIEQTTVWHMGVGPEFASVMGLTIVEGHGPVDEVPSAAAGAAGPGPQGPPRITEIVVNEALVRGLHWKEAIGKRFQLGQGPGGQSGTVVGVVKDFNFRSVHDPVAPFAIYRQIDNFAQLPPQARQRITRPMVVNISGKDVPGTIDFLRETIRKFDSIHPLEFEFLDDSLNRLYASDQRLTGLIGIFAGFCIFIACLGLFGLASFTAAQRTREIGVRKVFGARTGQIISLLAQRIVYLVIAAAVVASVLAYLAMTAWLRSFAFHTSINPLIFVLAALAGLGIAYVTVAAQSLKAARAHPVRALRYE
ncbi:MAG TPA: FtsX-like permease family protein [Gammaproteobacteria bacterium]|nr:FtsX-like permease family protein [Gammaproteobacteria bacterium]